MRNTRFEVRLTSGALGAELLGIDLAHALDAEAVADIRRAFHEHGVIFFRDQRLKPEQHIAFAERMGPIIINRFFKTVPGYPQITEVRKEPAQTTADLNFLTVFMEDFSTDDSAMINAQRPLIGRAPANQLLSSLAKEFASTTKRVTLLALFFGHHEAVTLGPRRC
jgi:Taurine catabolism dioxygenase TauD, TfdA family